MARGETTVHLNEDPAFDLPPQQRLKDFSNQMRPYQPLAAEHAVIDVVLVDAMAKPGRAHGQWPSLKPRPQLRECQSAGKVCDAYKQKKAKRDQYIALTNRYPFKFN
jgi:hypothetical protein